MGTSWSLVKEELRSASETVLRRPASDRWNVDAVKAMQASPRVPNPENLRQAKVMPERLTKRMEVEGDGSKIQEQVRRFQEIKFASSKSPRAFLRSWGLRTIAKVVKQLRLGRTPGGTPMIADEGWNS